MTFCIVGAILAICASIYVRDLMASAPHPSDRIQAQFDADRALTALAPAGSCGRHCAATVLGQSAPNVWRIKLITPSWNRCILVDTRAFAESTEHGFAGLQSVACP